MKKFALFILILLAVIAATGEGSVVAYAAETEDIESEAEKELQQNISDLLDELDLQDLQEYLDTLTEFHGISVKDKLKGLIDGDLSLDYSSLGNAVLHTFLEEITLLFPAFAVIVAASLLCGILNSAKSGFLHSTMSDIIGLIALLAVGASVLACLVSVLSSVFSSVKAMKTQMELVYPVLLTLMAAGGGTVSAAVFRPAVVCFFGAATRPHLSMTSTRHGATY